MLENILVTFGAIARLHKGRGTNASGERSATGQEFYSKTRRVWKD